MPDWTNSKLFCVLMSAALALSCYPVPARAFADDFESEGVSDASYTDSGDGLAGGVRSFEPDDIPAGFGFPDAVVSPGDNEGEGEAQEPGFESDGVSLGSSTSEEVASSYPDSAYPYGLLPDDFDETDLSTYPDWALYSEYIGASYETISLVIEGLTEKRYSETLTYDETIVYYQACYALLSLLQDEGYDSSAYGWGTVSTIVGIFDTVLGWANPGANGDSKLATVLTALVYGVQVDSSGNVSFPLDNTYSSRGIAGLLVNQLNYLANISSNSTTSKNELSIIASNSANLSNRSIYNGYSFSRILYELWDDLEKDGYSVADFLAAIDTNLHSNGYGAARLLYEIWDDLEYVANGKSYSVAHSAYGIWEDVETLDGHVVNNGSLVSKGLSDIYSRLSAPDNVSGTVYNASQYLTQIKNRLGDTYNGTYYTAGQLFRIIVTRLDTLRDNGVADASMVSKGFSDIYNRLSASDPMNNNSPANVAQYLAYIKNRLGDTYNGTYYTAGQLMRIIVTRLDTLRSNGVSRDSLISKGFSDVIAALDTREVVITGDLELGDVTVDNSGVESRLDDIKNLLLLAGVKDVVDDLLGDFDSVIGENLVDSVEDALSSAFPFCIPAVAKQVLGLLVYEGAPPVYEFDIGGAPLVLDFSVASDFAEISRWVTTVAFVLVLLGNTKRFIFDFTGGAS